MAVPLTKVPTELRKILLDFTLSCLVEKPDDYAVHGLAYFVEMRECRNNKRKSRIEVEKFKDKKDGDNKDKDKKDEDEESSSGGSVNFDVVANRRASVWAERYDPTIDSDSAGASIVIPKTEEERKMLAEDIKSVLIFRSLDTVELASLMDAMHAKLVTKDEIIIEQGDNNASNFYVIESGSYEAWVTDETGVSNLVKVYQDRGSFGELALLYNVPRAATIKAISDGKLWVLDRDTFRKIVLKSAYLKRERYQKLFEEVEFLKILGSYAKLDLADSLIPKFYKDDEVIFMQGDEADGMYFVESGGINCIINHPLQGDVIVTELHEGDYLGELALITHKPRALTAKAVGNTKLAFLDKDAFERLLGPCQEFLQKHFSAYEIQLVEAVGSSTTIYYKDSKLSGDKRF